MQDQASPLHSVDAAGIVLQFAVLGPQFSVAGGAVAARNITFGSAQLNFGSNELSDVGKFRVVCLRAALVSGTCTSPAFCVQVCDALSL